MTIGTLQDRNPTTGRYEIVGATVELTTDEWRQFLAGEPIRKITGTADGEFLVTLQSTKVLDPYR